MHLNHKLLYDLEIRNNLTKSKNISKLCCAWEDLLSISCLEQQALQIINLIQSIINTQRFTLTPSGCSWNLYAPRLDRQPPDPFNLPNGILLINEIISKTSITTLNSIETLGSIASCCEGRDKKNFFPKRLPNTICFYKMIILWYQFIYQNADYADRKYLKHISCSKTNLYLKNEIAGYLINLNTLLQCSINNELPINNTEPCQFK